MDNAIVADGLSKRYHLGERQAYGALRDSIGRMITAPFRLVSRRQGDAAPTREILWALRDVSFDVKEGEVLGVIGRNGSGKSTLLKILSRITEPTAGVARLHGRVGSLLEVGTGFHPELTGRENVFVNGAILGMQRAEIARKFDEIVAFADVDRFIDTPVKFYSSGMQMRLAFAVAAHLEPEILLIDEVLAVGDLAFQKKCLGKMDDVSRSGRTVLFVSHQMNQLRRVCGRCLWLDAGEVVAVGQTPEITNRYEASFMQQAATGRTAHGTKGAEFLGWTLGPVGSSEHAVETFDRVTVRFLLRIDRPLRNVHHGVALYDSQGRVTWGTGTDGLDFEPGLFDLAYTLDSLPLRPGPYRWLVSIYESGNLVDRGDCIPDLAVVTPPLGHRQDDYAGFLNLPYELSIANTDVPTGAGASNG